MLAVLGTVGMHHRRIIANATRRSTSGLRRLLRRPRRFEIRPVAPSNGWFFCELAANAAR